MTRPWFRGPRPYVYIPPESNGPLYGKHNHCPAIVDCANGDLLVAWFSTNTEQGREMTIAASRLRRAAAQYAAWPVRNKRSHSCGAA